MKEFEKNLIETRNRLINEISQYSFADFNKKTDPDKWSAAQVCHHLVLVEKSFTNAIVYGLKKTESNPTGTIDIHAIMDRTKKFNAPEIVVPSSEPMDVQEVIGLLNESRKELIGVLDAVSDKSILSEKTVKHPIFGYLSLKQWVELLYLHEERHTEQIKEIVSL